MRPSQEEISEDQPRSGGPSGSGAGRSRSRRRWWIAAGFVALAAVVALVASVVTWNSEPEDDGRLHEFASRPDLTPPKVDITAHAGGTPPGHVFLGPMIPRPEEVDLDAMPQAGPMIVDDRGEPVWFKPDPPGVVSMDFKVQEYQGQPVMTWWQGEMIAPPGYGKGEVVIMDQSYREIAKVRTGNGMRADMHDFIITPRGTGLLLSYDEVRRDLTGVGGPADAPVLEGVVQEVDIATGDVLFEWHSLDHVGLEESLEALPEDPNVPWDYFHINSVEVDGDGQLLISARHTHAVYQLDRSDGAVNWRLSGKNTDFAMGEGAIFEWQHDARRQPDGTISIFDNADEVVGKDRSRGIALRVDEQARTAELVREDVRPAPVISPNMANYQLRADGHAFAGWGGADGFTEFGPDGSVLVDGKLPEGMNSYRAFRFPWVGEPADDPAVAAESGSGDETIVHASWNGATEVEGWRVLAGSDPRALSPVAEAERAGFETRIEAPGQERYVAVEALDARGQVVGTSPSTEVS